MYYLSRTIIFIACLAVAVFADKTIGAVALIASVFIIPNPASSSPNRKPQ